MASDRFTTMFARTDYRISRAMGFKRESVYASSIDLLWRPDEEGWPLEKQSIENTALCTGVLRSPPSDKGRGAYLFLLCAFIIQAIMWGIPLMSASTFTAYYMSQPVFKQNQSIAVIGILATGLPLLGAPLITPLVSKWHRHQPFMIWLGWLVCTFALLAASFSTTIPELILTQGLMYGIGLLCFFYAMLSMLNEWFIERRGLAYGVLFAASGLSATALPLLAQVCLRKFDYAWTLRGFAIALVVLVAPILPFCRGRLSPQISAEATTVGFKRVLSNPLVYFFSAANIFQSLAFYLPSLYVTMFAKTMGLSQEQGVIVVVCLNLAQVFSQVSFGYLSDCTNIFALMLISSVGSAIFGCVLWYIASTFAHLIAFAITYGLFAGGYMVLYARFCSACAEDAPSSLWLLGIFACERGIGSVVAGPISAALLHMLQQQQKQNRITDPAYAFRKLSIFVGACMVASTMGALGYFWRTYASAPGRSTTCKLLRQPTGWKKGEKPVITIQRPKSVVHYRSSSGYRESGRPF